MASLSGWTGFQPVQDTAPRVFSLSSDAGMSSFTTPAKVQHVDTIGHKPVPRWPDRRSYRTVAREARTRRNIQKRGAK